MGPLLALLHFEIRRFLRQRNLLMGIVSAVLIGGIALAISGGKSAASLGDYNQVSNLYAVISQFVFLVIIPMVSSAFTSDYEKKSLIFYFQNKVSPLRLFMLRILIYDVFVILLYWVLFAFFVFYYGIYLDSKVLSIFMLLTFVIIYCVHINMMLSVVFQKRTTSMMVGILVWISVYILGLIAARINFMDGLVSLIDGSSILAVYVQNIQNHVPQTAQTLINVLEISIFWILIPLILSSLAIHKGVAKKNAI